MTAPVDREDMIFRILSAMQDTRSVDANIWYYARHVVDQLIIPWRREWMAEAREAALAEARRELAA